MELCVNNSCSDYSLHVHVLSNHSPLYAQYLLPSRRVEFVDVSGTRCERFRTRRRVCLSILGCIQELCFDECIQDDEYSFYYLGMHTSSQFVEVYIPEEKTALNTAGVH